MGKEFACNAGDAEDAGSITGSERAPGGGRGNPLQYSCLENPHGQRNLAVYSPCHARGEGERVLALESREGTRASRRVEEGLSRSFSGGRREPSCPSPSAGDLRALPRVPLRGEGCIVGRGESGLVLCAGPNVHVKGRQGSQGCILDSPGESGLVLRGKKGLRPRFPRLLPGTLGNFPACL